MNLTIVPARADEEPLIIGLHQAAARWLASIGSDQWQTSNPARMAGAGERNVHAAIARGEVFLVRLDGHVVGTLTLDDYADPEFWTPEDQPETALYVHRMVIDRQHAGHGLGALMLDWASQRAAAAGKRWLRLDAWRTNHALQAYYAGQGFTHVRTVDLPHRGSGALFQRAVATN